MKTTARILFLIVLLAVTAAIAEAATVRAVVDRNSAMVGESISLQIVIEGGDGEIDMNGLTDFTVISRGTSSNFQMINGRTSRQKIHNFVLIPLHAGNLTIPAIAVTIDGDVHHTAPIRLSVTEEPPADSGRRDVYVTADISNSSPWIGQQFAYTFRLFNAVQVADAKFQPPEFNGFNAEQLENQKTYRTVINGREFMVSEVTVVLVPVRSGQLTIEPAVLRAGLVQRSRRPRPFSGMDAFFGRSELTTRVLETEPVAVHVRDLPSKPPGTLFSGLVGQFEIGASLDKAAIGVGDSTTLAVTISGNGNIMDAATPVIPVPKGFKTYVDNPEEQIQLGPDGYTGSKTFRTALVPVEPGQYRIDPISLTYFDVKEGRYKTSATTAFEVTASPSETAVTDIDVFRASPGQKLTLKKRVEFTGRDILPLKTGLAVVAPQRDMSFLWFCLLLLFPGMGFAATAVVIRMKRKDDSPGRAMADRAKQALQAAASADRVDADFLSALYKALVSAILSKKGVAGTSLTWSEAKKELTGLGWEVTDANETAKLLERIESFNYSGGALDREKRKTLLEQTRRAVKRLTR